MKYWQCPPLNKEQLLQKQRPVPGDGDPSNNSKCAAADARRFLATVSWIYCMSYIFLKGFLQAKTQQALASGSRFLGTGT